MWWILFALLSAITAALVAIFGKIGIQNVDTTAATMVRAAVMFIFLLGATLILKKLPELNTISHKALFWIILSGLAGALSWFFYFLALKLGPAAKVASLDRLSIVFVVILAALFLAEKITLKIAIGAVLMVIGAILIAL
jgi:transporter family protein